MPPGSPRTAPWRASIGSSKANAALNLAETPIMIWLLGGYLWLYVHRPFEIWQTLGNLQVERAYMLVMMLVWLVTPNKRLPGNRAHVGMALFAFAMLVTWVA